MQGIIDHGQIRCCQGAAALFIFAALEDAQGVSFNGVIYLIYNLLGPTRKADVSLHGWARLFEGRARLCTVSCLAFVLLGATHASLVW